MSRLVSTRIVNSEAGLESYKIQKFWDKSINYDYYSQDANNACGPACVQMVLGFFNVKPLPTQVTLASEMNTTIYEYTYTPYVSKPFQDRNIGIVFDGNLSKEFSEAIQQLKANVSLNRPAILLMWYNQSNETGHYRVVTGYNQTGFFFHDPQEGPDIFFANTLFEKLWTKYDHWALILGSGQPYNPTSSNSQVILIAISATTIVVLVIAALSYRRRRGHSGRALNSWAPYTCAFI
jgi:predicted double-glycine peptidase